MLATFLLALALPVQASSCVETQPRHIGETQVYVMDLGGRCMVSVDPSLTLSMVYRSYSVYDDGLIMVFNSYGPGEDVAKYTAAREFMFFPRSHGVDVKIDERAQTLAVVMANGDALSFNTTTGQPASSGRGSVVVAPSVDPANRGGVEFPSYAGLVLDLGFARGHAPSDRADNEASFRDAQGQLCAVKNSEIFNYTPDGEHAFKFDDVQLVNWLRFRCPFLTPGFPGPANNG